MIKKHILFLVFAAGCMVLGSGIGFTADTPKTKGFLNNNSVNPLQAAPASIGMATARDFQPTDFSLPQASLDRLDHISMEKLLTEGADAPITKPTSTKKKIGKIMAIAGLGATGVGTIMLIANGGNDPKEIGDTGMGIDWKATGIAWIGVGLAVAIAGFILMGLK